MTAALSCILTILRRNRLAGVADLIEQRSKIKSPSAISPVYLAVLDEHMKLIGYEFDFS